MVFEFRFRCLLEYVVYKDETKFMSGRPWNMFPNATDGGANHYVYIIDINVVLQRARETQQVIKENTSKCAPFFKYQKS